LGYVGVCFVRTTTLVGMLPRRLQVLLDILLEYTYLLSLRFPLLPVVVGTGVVEQMIVAMMSCMFLVVEVVLVMFV
jgi:hypothetical protein